MKIKKMMKKVKWMEADQFVLQKYLDRVKFIGEPRLDLNEYCRTHAVSAIYGAL